MAPHFSGRGRVTALLGPTNTGKTHLAVTRMLNHDSGMIGVPLRLLARETYDRVVAARGAAAVALITGEEKILPARPRYWICTIESMPVGTPVDFLAVDEIQLAADPERGHAVTARLLRSRGLRETLFLGAETMTEMVRRLVPEAEIETRPRLSELRFRGPARLDRLPPRSAVVGFSVDELYRTAEALRRRRGGAALVLGALSPRARNAQVAMYQAGEVDFLVATDAIGMGLNMDIDHVAFAGLEKFDGRRMRPLATDEIAQIAGRAGRHTRNGAFGTTGDAPELTPERAAAVEAHSFAPVTRLVWRNGDLALDSPRALLRDLRAVPPRGELTHGREGADVAALDALARDAEIAALARGPERTALLWEVCQIPDFRPAALQGGGGAQDDGDEPRGAAGGAAHRALLREIYCHLARPGGHGGEATPARLPADWIARHVAPLDSVAGEIDTLMARLAEIRRWSFIAHRGHWLAEPEQWQAHMRAIEDRISDALHDRLTARFVDRRVGVLVRGLGLGPGPGPGPGEDMSGARPDAEPPMPEIAGDGTVRLVGQILGRLEGFAFNADPDLASAAVDLDPGAARQAAERALAPIVARRLEALETAPEDSFVLDSGGGLWWRPQEGADAARIGWLAPGPEALSPAIRVRATALLDKAARARIARRLQAVAEARLAPALTPLRALRTAALEGPARGIAYQLAEGLGHLPRRQVADLVAGLDRGQRKALREAGVRLGRRYVRCEGLARPAAIAARARLWCLARAGHGALAPEARPGDGDGEATDPAAALPPAGAMSARPAPGLPAAYYAAIGYPLLGGLALREDMAERLLGLVEARLAESPADGPPRGRFWPDSQMANAIGAGHEALAAVLRALGYAPTEPGTAETGPSETGNKGGAASGLWGRAGRGRSRRSARKGRRAAEGGRENEGRGDERRAKGRRTDRGGFVNRPFAGLGEGSR